MDNLKDSSKFQQGFRKVRSYLGGIMLEKVYSRVGGKPMEIWYMRGKNMLFTDRANYSFGGLHLLFQKVFRKLRIKERKIDSVLVLGMGAGSIISILRVELNIFCDITAIEYDPAVIEIANKYFDIQRFKKLIIFNEDAADFVKRETKTYDLITIDLFNDDVVPSKFTQADFIKDVCRLVNPGGVLCFNFIIQKDKNENQFENMKQAFQNEKGQLAIWPMFTGTRIFVWEKV